VIADYRAVRRQVLWLPDTLDRAEQGERPASVDFVASAI
jgi:hypothetical protein